eukprot:15350181-Ditylum_brightwellii.AAC.1
MDDWFNTIARMYSDDDFVPPENWEDLLWLSCFNSLLDWDPIVDGDLSDLAAKGLSDHEIEQCWQTRWYKTGALLPVMYVPTVPTCGVQNNGTSASEGDVMPPLLQCGNDSDRSNNKDDDDVSIPFLCCNPH